MKETVLITGGSGLLALNWAQAIRDEYAVVLGIHTRAVSLPGVESRQVDLESQDAVQSIIEKLMPAVIVHAAGMTSVEACESDPHRARQVNVDLATRVARVCARCRIPMIHISTDHLFSSGVSLASEDQAVCPTNVYGKTKAEAERRVLEAHPRALVVRTNFYCWGTSYRRSFSDVIVQALRQRAPITLFQDVYYNPILAEALVRSAHDLAARGAHGIFHVVGDDRISKHQFGLKLAAHMRLDSSVIRAGNLADASHLVSRPYDMSLSNRKVCGVLGRPMGGVDEHIRRLFDQEGGGLAQEVQNL